MTVPPELLLRKWLAELDRRYIKRVIAEIYRCRLSTLPGHDARHYHVADRRADMALIKGSWWHCYKGRFGYRIMSAAYLFGMGARAPWAIRVPHGNVTSIQVALRWQIPARARYFMDKGAEHRRARNSIHVQIEGEWRDFKLLTDFGAKRKRRQRKS